MSETCFVNTVRIYQYRPLWATKAKAVPLHAIEAFETSALDGGEWSASRPGRALAPGKGPSVPRVQEVVWAPEPVWTQRLEEKSFAPAGDRTSIARSSRHYSNQILHWLSYPASCCKRLFSLFKVKLRSVILIDVHVEGRIQIATR
jgi:hypothetical protein